MPLRVASCLGGVGQEIGDAGNPLVDLAAKGSTVRGAGGLDVLESDGLTGVLQADGPAEEAIAVEHPDLGEVARIIAKGHRFADISGQGGVEIAQPLEVDAVAVDDAGLGDHDQQQIQLFETVGHSRQPPIAEPCRAGRRPGFAVHPHVIGADEEGAHRGIQFGERQPWRGGRLAAHEVPGQFGEEFRVQGAE